MPGKPKRKVLQRQPRRPGRAGGRQGRLLRDRLRELLAEHGGTKHAFARKIGVDPSRLSEWLSGRNQISIEHLRVIASATNVSLDWLLLGEAFLGAPSAIPIYRGESRPVADLQHDLVAYAVREINRRAAVGELPEQLNAHFRGMQVNAPRLFEYVIENAIDEMMRIVAENYDETKRVVVMRGDGERKRVISSRDLPPVAMSDPR
jgi:transcriptional regulator with XRE-family HTH domain